MIFELLTESGYYRLICLPSGYSTSMARGLRSCTRVRTYTRGLIYTETKYYHVYRKVDLNYKRIPVMPKKMDDKMMDR